MINNRKQKRITPGLAMLVGVGLLSACAERTKPAPVVNLSNHVVAKKQLPPIDSERYKVKKGETLYSIAFRAKTDVRALAQLNNLKPPYHIYPDQILLLSAASAAVASPAVTAKNNSVSAQKIIKKTVANDKPKEYGVKKESTFTAVKVPSLKQKVNEWIWPVKGNILSAFDTADKGSQGIEIDGKRGQPVKAAADGLVVYAGSALRGYGNLIIIKHNDDYLSAYAHNDELLVNEQQTVSAGKVIAKMGSTGTDRTKLRFEIRFRGKSVNPMHYLPN
ncbi:peptidoglycan DD-metalloendopeptidase family protein [Thalassotalea ponticola]|uniref:peptidoglycan DD-metalloendopeptidase family protein n=1 Tax=Thalassotalea ponticola TaxID=1523392 RepID=UPI0025B2D32A|nr:peptidoglycan DD-metalloendopeptidase family protein [Thalassotalea ponticola]MDN3652138.1 peptidoglycan DD-metalloendopeptidase family protein [Thalassotalea ponticola]